ncbi:MAG: ferrochelatase [Actinomycetota bacterium]
MTELHEGRAVLVMAYGTPRGPDDVEAYYTDIRRGRPPPPELLADLQQRYRAIGGSPLLEITQAQASGLGERLSIPTYLGQKHAAPFIADAVGAMAKDNVDRAVGLVLAPHYSKMSVGDYRRRALDAATQGGWTGRLEVVESWHLEPGYVTLLARAVKTAVAETVPDATVVFSAHSLPERILEAGDPYPDQVHQTAEAVASACSLTNWTVGWQSAGRTTEKWLGPTILEVMEREAAHGAPAVIICPCGFVSDHLEVLYDVDIEAAQSAKKLGIGFGRTAMPNDEPDFLDILATVVRRALN